MLVKLHCGHFLFCVCETIWQRTIYGIIRPQSSKLHQNMVTSVAVGFLTSFKEKTLKVQTMFICTFKWQSLGGKKVEIQVFFGNWDNWEVNWSLSSCHPCLFGFLRLGLLHEICFHSRMSDYLFFCLAGTVLHAMWYKGIPGLSSCSYLGNLARISFENSVHIRS